MDYLPKPKRSKLKKITPGDDRGPDEMKRYVYWRGFFDIQFFVRYHLGHFLVNDDGESIEPGEFHKQFLEEMQNTSNVVIRFPRNHGKTTNIIFTTIRDICYEQEKGILFVMQKGLGEKTLNKIRTEFEVNENLISIFGRLVPQRKKEEQSKSRRVDYLMFMNGVDLQIITKGQAIRGARKTKGYIDDPEEDKETSEKMMKDLRDWVAGTIMPIFTRGNLKVTGTVIHNDCFVNFLYRSENTFAKVSMEAIKDPVFENKDGVEHLVGGEAIRPGRMSVDILGKLLLDMQSVSDNGFDIWKREFLHIPFNDAGERIRKDLTLEKLITPEPIETIGDLKIYKKPGDRHYIGVDTSAGLKTGDYSSIVVRDTEQCLVATRYSRGGPDDIIETLDLLYDKGYEGTVGIEVNNETGGTTITLARGKDREMNMYLRINNEDIGMSESRKYGWLTGKATRDTALGEYYVATRQSYIKEVSAEILAEMKYFIKSDKNGKREASVGYHDDGIMSDAICYQMRKEHVTDRS